MRKLVKGVIILVILGLIGYSIYHYFIAGKKYNSFFEREISLNVLDRVSVEDELYIKLVEVKDNRCKGNDCEREGEQVAKFVVINEHRISYVEIGTNAESLTKIPKKMAYSIELIEIADDGKTTIKVNKLD